jgi:pentose-5-phosphate-3-epimerase
LAIESCGPYLEAFAHVGCNSVAVHAEATKNLDHWLQTIRAAGKKAGYNRNARTPDH